MKKDFSPELQKLLEEHSEQNDLDLVFECKKQLNVYSIKIIDAYGDADYKQIDQQIVSDFLKDHSLKSKQEIIEIIFNPGPRVTNTPG